MESILNFIIDHASYAHCFIFFLFMFAGINFPISIDLLITLLASKQVSENVLKLFLSFFLGTSFFDWISYWVGRKWREYICEIKWFFPSMKLEKFQVVQESYLRYGSLALLIRRFIPLEFRNSLCVVTGS